jgi:hypothetical protein
MTTTSGVHDDHGVHPIHPFGAAAGSAANMRRSVVVATAFIVLGLSAWAGSALAHENAEKSDQTVIKLVPRSVPSGSPVLRFQGCP